MSDWSPPKLPRKWLYGLSFLYVVVLAYAVIIASRFLFGIWIGVVFIFMYLLWRFIVAFEGIAGALQEMASQRDSQ